MSYEPQVNRSHYEGSAYRSKERWISYFHQLDLMHLTKAGSVLEIGLGHGTTSRELKARGFSVTTADVAEDLHPDIVCSVTDLKVPDNSFDAVLAAEILEHIRFEDVPKALSEIARVCRTHAVISIPHPGFVSSIILKLPKLRLSFLLKMPFFWQRKTATPEHYWELGRPGYSVSRFVCEADAAGLRLQFSKSYADDPAHRFFLFSKKL
jgi:ubiquinone/menaquinone biosynthesis C-methylase UbiE